MKCMYRYKCLGTYVIAALLVACNISSAETSADTRFSLETLYTIPSLIGTPVESINWSGDSENIAFLWNSKGYPDSEVWVFSLATGVKRQLTNHSDDKTKGETQSRISRLQWLNNRRIIYALDGDIYSVDLDGNSTLIETPENTPGQLMVSPDGKHISYVTESGLWVSDVNRKENNARRLVNSVGKDVFIESYKWSGDGRKIAFVMADDRSAHHLEIPYFAQGKAQIHSVTRGFPGDETTKRQIGLLDVSNARKTMLKRSDEHDPIWGYGWSADSHDLFVDSSDFLVTRRNITIYDAKTAAANVYYNSASNHVPHTPAWSAAWAPDDDGLVILSDHEGFYQLYLLSEPGGTLVPLTEGEWEIASFTVDYAHSQVYFIANKGHVADRQLYRVPLMPGGSIEKVSTAPGTYEPFYAPDFQYVAFRFSDDTTPPDLYYQMLNSVKKPLKVTQSPQDRFHRYTWADVRYVEFPSDGDGTKLFGRLYRPKNFDPSHRYPLIVGSVYSNTVRNQWGGRSVHPTWGLDQYLVSQGYLVFSVNVHGSWGQGSAFRKGLREFGDIDIEDIESGVRYLVSQGYVDPDRVGIWGSSYGGLLTAMSLFKKPGVYAAGIAAAPATNVWHAYPTQMRVMGEPEGDDFPARYERQSALFQTTGLEDPLMIIHGTKDDVVLYSDSITLVEKLIAGNKMFELVTIPGSGHHWDNKSIEQTLFAYGKIVEFFDRNLDRSAGN